MVQSFRLGKWSGAGILVLDKIYILSINYGHYYT